MSMEEELEEKFNQEARLKGIVEEIKTRDDLFKEEITRYKNKLWEQQQLNDSNQREQTEQRYIIDRTTNDKLALESEIEIIKKELSMVRGESERTIAEKREKHFNALTNSSFKLPNGKQITL